MAGSFLDAIGFGSAAPARAPGVKPGGATSSNAPRRSAAAPVQSPGAAGTARAGERPPYPYPNGAAANIPEGIPSPSAFFSYSPWYRAAWIISTTLARTPLHVCKLSREGDADPIFNHRSSKCLTFQANDEETAMQARCRATLYALVHGRALCVPVDVRGERQLIPLLPGDWFPVRVDGEKWYVIDIYNSPADPLRIKNEDRLARARKVRATEAVEITGLVPDGLLGLALWWVAQGAVLEGLAASRVRSGRATNAGRPAVVLSTDQAMQPDAIRRVQDDFVRIHEGFEDSQIPAVLDRGLKASVLGYAAEQAHEAALAALPLSDVSNFTGVPVSFLAAPNRSDNTLETDDIQLDRYALGWWYDAWEDQGNAKLLEPGEWVDQKRAVRFDRNRLQWLDSRGRSEMVRTYLAGTPVADSNEVRRRIGFPGRSEPEASRLLIPLNMGQGGQQNQPANPADPGRADRPAKSRCRWRSCRRASASGSPRCGRWCTTRRRAWSNGSRPTRSAARPRPAPTPASLRRSARNTGQGGERNRTFSAASAPRFPTCPSWSRGSWTRYRTRRLIRRYRSCCPNWPPGSNPKSPKRRLRGVYRKGFPMPFDDQPAEPVASRKVQRYFPGWKPTSSRTSGRTRGSGGGSCVGCNGSASTPP
jgi:HK97 family phage portal protein